MRNEHRSRSYGSLANLEFEPNGEAEPGFEQKKDREIMQMMEDLHMAEDHIERSEVPPDFYPPPRNYRGQGGPPPQMHMIPGTNGPIPGRRRR